MAEPPTAWTVPGDEPDDRDSSGRPPSASPLPVSPALTDPTMPVPAASPTAAQQPTHQSTHQSTWGAPPAAQQPNWGAPPEHGRPSGWGPPPGQPSPWGGAPHPGSGQPGQWGGQPNPGTGPQWSGPPAPGNWVSRGPGIIPLRPLAIGEIYDGVIRAIRSNPRTMVGFSAIVIALLTLLATIPQAYAMTSLLNGALADPTASDEDLSTAAMADAFGPLAITTLIGVLEFILATTIISALLIVAVDGAVRGKALNPGQLWARCRSRLFAVLGLACVVVVVMPLVLLVAIAPGLILAFTLSSPVPGGLLIALGVLVALVVDFALYFGFWAVAAPALLLENLGVFAALRRSSRLVRGGFWRVFGIGVLTAVIAYIIQQVFSIPFAIIGMIATGFATGFETTPGFSTNLIQMLITSIGTVLAGAVAFPFTSGVAALLYLDLRMRREGLDVDLMRS